MPCLLCDRLSGQVRNLDPVENAAALWAPRAELTRYVPADQIFAPVIAVLEETDAR